MERKCSTVTKRKPSGAAVFQSSVTVALQRALFGEWAARGYGSLSLEAVAARAGVGKAALYRRWSCKAEMANEALQAFGVTITAMPDTGSLEGDVRGFIWSLRRVLHHPLVRRIVPDLHAELGRSDDLRAAVTELDARRRSRAADMLRRAIAREELPATLDLEMAIDFLPGPMYWRIVVTRGKTDRSYLERLLPVTLIALRSC